MRAPCPVVRSSYFDFFSKYVRWPRDTYMSTYRYLILCSRTKKAFEPLKVRQHLRLANSNICLEFLISAILFSKSVRWLYVPSERHITMQLYDARLPNLKASSIVELAKTKLGIAMNCS